jgi:hypothetical protein
MGRRDFSDDSHAGQCFVPERADSKPMAAPPPPLARTVVGRAPGVARHRLR